MCVNILLLPVRRVVPCSGFCKAAINLQTIAVFTKAALVVTKWSIEEGVIKPHTWVPLKEIYLFLNCTDCFPLNDLCSQRSVWHVRKIQMWCSVSVCVCVCVRERETERERQRERDRERQRERERETERDRERETETERKRVARMP